MVFAFVFVGMGTSSMYFAGVTTSAKNFTGSRGLALSLPIASFGLSSLWQSQLVSRLFTDKQTGELEISKVFLAYSLFLMAVGTVGFLGLRIVQDDKIEEEGEHERLLEGGRNIITTYGAGEYSAVDTQELEKKPFLNAATRDFLKDRTMWWFAAGVFLVTGPGEAFINNVCPAPAIHSFCTC
jgi:hypothetical protein